MRSPPIHKLTDVSKTGYLQSHDAAQFMQIHFSRSLCCGQCLTVSPCGIRYCLTTCGMEYYFTTCRIKYCFITCGMEYCFTTRGIGIAFGSSSCAPEGINTVRATITIIVCQPMLTETLYNEDQRENGL